MKTVIVTGASQGLGQRVAQAFLGKDWRVIGTGRSPRPEALDEKVEYQQFDASDAAASANFWKQLKIDDDTVCLVNNAGGYVGGKLLDTKPEDYEKQMRSNYFAGVYMTRGLVENVETARIINLISNSALVVHPNDSAYGASKAAAQHFFQSLQKEFSPKQYQITNLYPSSIATQGNNPEAIDPDDLAALIVELAESHTSYYPADIILHPTS